MTINNYSEEDYEALARLPYKYLVYGREVGDSGTPHLQCYVNLKNACTRSAISKKIPRAWIDRANGTPEEASDYCKKDGDFEEFGDPPLSKAAQGALGKAAAHARWKEVAARAAAGDYEWLADHEPYYWLNNELKLRAKRQFTVVDIPVLQNEWRYGPARTGKSRSSRLENPGCFVKAADTEWWDGYADEDVVLIDDFDKYHVSQGYHLKVWSDHYAFRAQVKGGTLLIRPRKIGRAHV